MDLSFLGTNVFSTLLLSSRLQFAAPDREFKGEFNETFGCSTYTPELGACCYVFFVIHHTDTLG